MPNNSTDYAVVAASYSDDHKSLIRLSRQTPYTKSFCDVRYPQEYYDRGEVGKLVAVSDQSARPVGFVLTRRCKTRPYTSIYYLLVDEQLRGLGLGGKLLKWVQATSPWPELRLGVDEHNEAGRRFWEREGFVPADPPFTETKHGLKILQMRRSLVDAQTTEPTEGPTQPMGDDRDHDLDCYTFGRRLVETGDLDPVYILLWEASLEPDTLERWLLAYWCFYHVGVACWAADRGDAGDYWGALGTAAGSKEYPRCHERRHFRGAAALGAVERLRSRGVTALFNDLYAAGPTARDVIAAVTGWHMFGPWIGFKVADMLERLGLRTVRFDTDTAFYKGSPQEGAELLWRVEHPGEGRRAEGKDESRWAAERILTELADLTAPPAHDRPLGVQEAETICCKWSSYTKGRYHLGEDIEGCRRALGWASARRSATAQRLFKAGKRGGLW